jgi:hypothetical protein
MHYDVAVLFAVSAWRYSAAYLLCGGGVLGAIVVYIGAKILKK